MVLSAIRTQVAFISSRYVNRPQSNAQQSRINDSPGILETFAAGTTFGSAADCAATQFAAAVPEAVECFAGPSVVAAAAVCWTLLFPAPHCASAVSNSVKNRRGKEKRQKKSVKIER